MERTTVVEEPPGESGWRRIERKIENLTCSNLEKTEEEVFEILKEGEITCQKQGNSIIKKLIDKTNDLYEEPCFGPFVQKLHLSVSRDEYLFDIIWQQFKFDWIENWTDARKCIAKLKIFLPLDSGLSTRFLHQQFQDRTYQSGTNNPQKNAHFVGVLLFLIRNGANPFQRIGGTFSFVSFLKKFGPYLNDGVVPSVKIFLEEVLEKIPKTQGFEERILNDVIFRIFELYSSNFSCIKVLIVETCIEIAGRAAYQCNYVDCAGKTPLHNLMEKLVVDDVWKTMPELVAGTDRLWDLMFQLITEKNVNIKDRDQVTAYSWILLWQEAVALQDVPDKQKLISKMEDIKKHFLEKGANVEDALHGLSSLHRYGRIEGMIQLLTPSNMETKMDEVLQVLAEGEIFYPSNKHSIFETLVKKTDDLYEQPSFGKLVKALQPSYRRKGDMFDNVIFQLFKPLKIEKESDAGKFIARLKIFLPLDDCFHTRFLHKLIQRCKDCDKNDHFLEVLTFLVTEGANPFQPIGGIVSFILFLEKFGLHQKDAMTPSVNIFLGEVFRELHITTTKEFQNNILNDVIKVLSGEILENSSYPSSINHLIVDICLEIIKSNPVLCDHEDEEARTPIHYLMEKLMVESAWERIPDLVSGTDYLLNLISQLITERNVNIKDSNQMTPYSWILLWQNAVASHDERDMQDLNKKIDHIKKHLQEKGASEEEAVQGLNSRIRLEKIQGKIKLLTNCNIEHEAKEVFKILEEGDIFFPSHGYSIFEKLVEKTNDLYEQHSFGKLIEVLHPSYQRNEDLFDFVIAKQFKPLKIENETDARKCIAKLKIFLPLDGDLCTRFLHKWMQRRLDSDTNIHFVEVLRFLLSNGANLFQPGGTVSLNTFLKMFGPHLNDTLMSSVTSFLGDIFINLDVSKTEDIQGNLLNDVIKAFSINIFENPGHLTSINVIVKICRAIITTNPVLCDHTDGEGRTPLHNLLEKLLIEGLWLRIPDFLARTESLWDLMPQLITEKNVNIRVANHVTPYSCFLLFSESVAFHDAPNRQELARTIEDVKSQFQEKGKNEEDAQQGLNYLRKQEMEGVLKRFFKFDEIMVELLKRTSGTTCHAELKKEEMDIERLRDLKSKVCQECILGLTATWEFKRFAKKHIELQNDRILGISRSILEVMIVKDNAQDIYDLMIQYKKYWKYENSKGKFNYFALFVALEQCLDNGAHPTMDEIHEILLLIAAECTSYEALLATFNVLKKLVVVYRKQENTEPMEIYVNPLQNLWNIRDNLRKAADEVIRATYGTLNDCMKSKSVINSLLFLRRDIVGDDIRKCFLRVEALLLTDANDPPVNKWLEEKGKHTDDHSEMENRDKELRWTSIKSNNNWLRRNILHLAAIFCHDEHVLNCIPNELIDKYIDGRDLHGCTPLHIAHMHDNHCAIQFLESHNATPFKDDFGILPEYSSAHQDTHYKNYCSEILTMNSSLFDNMKIMLALPVHECTAIREDLKELFTRMVSNDGFLNADIIIVGSVREKMKVGRWDEFDVQICTKIKPYEKKEPYPLNNEPFACMKLHLYFIKALELVDKKGISLRCISVHHPWKFIWEGEGSSNGIKISVDVVPVFVMDNLLKKQHRKNLIMANAPLHQPLEHLKWKVLEEKPTWQKTPCRHEWDILDNLPPGIRLGILISKALLEAQDQTSETDLTQRAITSYAVKNTLMWLMAGITPDGTTIELENISIIEQRYGAVRQQLLFTTNDPKWMSEEDLVRFAEEGRFWAEKIFDTLQFMARRSRIAFSCFVGDSRQCKLLQDAHMVIDMVDTCERCLERLRPQVFFTEMASASLGGDTGLRTRLQEIINKLNEHAETVLGGRLWKMRKEVKRLEKSIDDEAIRAELENYGMEIEKGPVKERIKFVNERINKLFKRVVVNKHSRQLRTTTLHPDKALLENDEKKFEKLDSEIKKLLRELGYASHKESVLFRIRGEIEELENNGNRDVAALTQKKQKCLELEKEVDVLRHDKKWHLHFEELEKMMIHSFQTDSTDGDKSDGPINGQSRDKTNMGHKNDTSAACENDTCNKDMPGNCRCTNSDVLQCDAQHDEELETTNRHIKAWHKPRKDQARVYNFNGKIRAGNRVREMQLRNAPKRTFVFKMKERHTIVIISDSRGAGFDEWIKHHGYCDDYDHVIKTSPGKDLSHMAAEAKEITSKLDTPFYCVIFAGICSLTEESILQGEKRLHYPLDARQDKVTKILDIIRDLSQPDENFNICFFVPVGLRKYFVHHNPAAVPPAILNDEQEALVDDINQINYVIDKLNGPRKTMTINLIKKVQIKRNTIIFKKRRLSTTDCRRVIEFIDKELVDGFHFSDGLKDMYFSMIYNTAIGDIIYQQNLIQNSQGLRDSKNE